MFTKFTKILKVYKIFTKFTKYSLNLLKTYIFTSRWWWQGQKEEVVKGKDKGQA